MAIRVIQWATGGVGRAAVAGVVAHPELELVGCWVHSPEKAGRDVGELCGLGPLGVMATADVDRLVGLDAECVVYSPIMADPAVVARLLASGKNVVTPLNWFFPGGRDEGRIEAACREGQVERPRHRDPPRGDHRALPVDRLRPVPVHHPRPGRGVLGHPQLRGPGGGGRHHALRQDPRGGGRQPDAGHPG